jgi:hypothetical protein
LASAGAAIGTIVLDAAGIHLNTGAPPDWLARFDVRRDGRINHNDNLILILMGPIAPLEKGASGLGAILLSTLCGPNQK